MKINLNNLYIVDLIMLGGYGSSTIAYFRDFKKTIVYRSILGNFYELSTGKRYKISFDANIYSDRIGKIFINEDTLIPLTSVMNFEEEKMSKKKILQKIKGSI